MHFRNRRLAPLLIFSLFVLASSLLSPRAALAQGARRSFRGSYQGTFLSEQTNVSGPVVFRITADRTRRGIRTVRGRGQFGDSPRLRLAGGYNPETRVLTLILRQKGRPRAEAYTLQLTFRTDIRSLFGPYTTTSSGQETDRGALDISRVPRDR